MDSLTNPKNILLRLILGLGASIGVGIVMAQQVDIVSTPMSIIVTILTLATSLISNKIICAVSPRRDKPSRYGAIAMILFLAAYIVLGKILWNTANIYLYFGYIVAGGIYLWLALTSVAETALLYAIGLGGFCSGFVSVVIMASYTKPLQALTSQINDTSIIYSSLGLICAIAGAFATIATRMSGWGLAENKTVEYWAFDSDGHLYVKND